jgi:hypothetical protein
MPRRRRSGRLALLVVVVVTVLAGCTGSGATRPEATPTDFPGIAARLRPLGITLENVLSGDAGCTDPELVKTAISFDATGLDQTAPVHVYLYIFRNDEAYEKLRPTVDLCARAYIADPAAYLTVNVSPYVATSQGPWAPEFEAAFRRGMAEAAGSG